MFCLGKSWGEIVKGSLSPKLKEIEKMVIQGKYNQALVQLDHNLEKENLSIEEYINCKILKTRIYYLIQPYSLALENGNEALQKSKEIGNHYLIFDSAIWMTWIYTLSGRINERKEVLEIAKQAINSIEDKKSTEYLRRESFYLRSSKGYSAGFEVILEDLNQCLKIANQINDDYEKGWILFYLGNLYNFFDKSSEALPFYVQSLIVGERTGDIELKMGSEGNMSDIYMLRGELDEAFQHMTKALALAEKMNSPFIIGILLGSIGNYYWYKGDIESTYSYYERSIDSFEKAKNTKHWHYPMIIYELARISLEMGDVRRALEIQDKLESIKNLHEEKHQSHRFFKIVKALNLKHQLTQGKEIDSNKKLEIENILEDLSFAKFVFANINKTALFHLCDLYVHEYHLSKDLSVFEKLKNTISRFLKIAEEQKSSILLAEVYLLESQLALIEYNTSKARTLLNKAQMIADEKGIHKLGTLISNAHDELIEQLDLWNSSTNQLPDIIDRLELTNLEELLNRFVKNKISYEDIILENEKPSLFLIVNQNGSISYTENFESSYLSENLINKLTETIINHEFAQNDSSSFIERTKVNGYNAIFQEIKGAKLCYAFIGKSYSAINKFRVLVQEFQDSISIWSNIREKIQSQLSIELDDRVQLSTYIQNLFA